MRRKDREKDAEFALSVIDKCEWAVMSCADAEGRPYGIPVSIVRDGDCVYFHTAKEGKKIQAIAKNPHVWFVCVGDVKRAEDAFTTAYESAMFEGECREVDDECEKVAALKLLCEKYTPDNMGNFESAVRASLARTGIYRTEICNLTGKAKVLKNTKRS